MWPLVLLCTKVTGTVYRGIDNCLVQGVWSVQEGSALTLVSFLPMLLW